jgi:hypothetical protein
LLKLARDFLVRVVCECGVCREIQPQALTRLVGWKMTLEELALRMRCSKCGRKAVACRNLTISDVLPIVSSDAAFLILSGTPRYARIQVRRAPLIGHIVQT